MSQELYEKRLGHVERDVAEVRGRLTGVEDKLGDLSGGMRSLSDGVHQLLRRDAERQAQSPYNVKDMLGMAVQGAILIGLCVSAIVYVAGGYYSADIALLKHKVSVLGTQQPSTWSTSTKR